MPEPLRMKEVLAKNEQIPEWMERERLRSDSGDYKTSSSVRRLLGFSQDKRPIRIPEEFLPEFMQRSRP
jgi:hypothetical protein